MSKTNSEDASIKEAIKLGERNKTLFPKIKNWCEHIKIEDRSAGLIAEMYNLPITLSISCPHSNGGFTGANLEWNAHDFILGNCLKCKFHSEVSKFNFGREVIDLQQKRDENVRKDAEEKAKASHIFKQYIDKIKLKDKNKTSITELSIIKIIDALDSSKIEKSKELLEASKISPHFFNNISVDYLCLYLNDTEINNLIFELIYNISNSRSDFSNFTIERLIDTSKSILNDFVSGIFLNTLDDEHLSQNIVFILPVMDNLQYERQIGDYYEKKYSYPNTIKLILKLYQLNEEFIRNIIKERILINDKTSRININGLLLEIIESDYELVKIFIDELILSLEFDDDGYNDSADSITCETLYRLFEKDSFLLCNHIIEKRNQLSAGALVELLNLIEKIVLNGSEQDAQKFLSILYNYISNKNEDIEVIKAAILIIKKVAKKRFKLIENNFDTLTGLLINLDNQLKLFSHYKAELSNNKISTYNPLQTLNFYEIDSLKLKISNNFDSFKSIISLCISNDSSLTNLNTIIKIIRDLESNKDGYIKSVFISILNKAANDQLFVADYLPQIHSHILDIYSLEVRIEGMNFLLRLFKDYPQLVTQNLIDLVKVFLNDTERIIIKKALNIYSYIFVNFPEQVSPNDLTLILQGIENTYTIIHKTSIELSYKIFPFLNSNQKLKWYLDLIGWEQTYFKIGDFYYSKDLVSMILFYNNSINTDDHILVIKHYYEKYCNISDYYTATDFIKGLNSIASDYPELNDFWLEQSMNFIGELKVDYINNHEEIIAPFFDNLYKQSSKLIIRNENIFLNFVSNKIKLGDYITLSRLLRVLAYYNLHEILSKYCSLLENFIPTVESNSYVLQQIALFQSIAKQEMSNSNN